MIKNFRFEDLSNKYDIHLKNNDIHVWIIELENAQKWSIQRWNWLSEEQKKEVRRYKLQDDKMRSLVSKVVLMELLEHYINLSHNDFKIETGMYGKPYINSRKADLIQFNISHSGSVVMLAFGKCKTLGLDVEMIRPIKNYKELAKNLYSFEEYLTIENMVDFFRCWTKKEAYLKALGTGLNKKLNSFSVVGNSIKDEEEILDRWNVVEIKVNNDYIAHIVINVLRKETVK